MPKLKVTLPFNGQQTYLQPRTPADFPKKR
jgi:hypothetical protein